MTGMKRMTEPYSKLKMIVCCVPVDLAATHAPDYLRIALRDDGSQFDAVPCPDCGQMMWLGRRSASRVANGLPMLCAVCLMASCMPDKTRQEIERVCASQLAESIQSKA